MITKKKTKGVAATKAKSAVKKIAKKVVAKKSAKGKSDKKTKSITKPKAKRTFVELPATPIATHGVDMHLIPVTGEIHPARTDEAPQFEKTFKHNEETALHLEQQRAKQIMATTRSGGGKRIFKSRRHS